VCLGALLTAAAAFAQGSPSVTISGSPAAKNPVAYVYVASNVSSQTNQIVAYAAASNGALSPVSGSPFQDNVYSMAVNGKYLMAADSTTPNVDAYLIGSDGSLTYATSTNYAKFNDPNNPCGSAGQMFFDHTGASLYVIEYDASDACANDVIASFSVEKGSGGLDYLGLVSSGTFPGDYTPAYFIGNNVYAYAADQSGCMYPGTYGYQRASNGLLNYVNNFTYNTPTPPPGVRTYYPNLAVADATNHVVIAEQPANPPGCANGPVQLATYTVESNGNIHTNSTYKNMPAPKVQNVFDMKTSPSGKLLAVAGQEGLQIFHFNGGGPLTHYTGLITTAPITQMFWDNNDHLYAISQTSGQLLVFTITPTAHKMAAGSPYAITQPQDIIVQPLSAQ
jgi:6-phosphogluconolactonase (cycloisomerase 2 family)